MNGVSTSVGPIGGIDREAFHLATERLLLRPIATDDWDVYRGLYTDPDTMRGIAEPLTEAATAKSFAICVRAWTRQPLRQIVLAVTELRDGGAIGIGSIFNFREDPRLGGSCAEVGVMIVEPKRSFGRGAEALRAVIACAFRNFGLDAVTGYCSMRNPRSERMITDIGFEPLCDRPEPGALAFRTWTLPRARFTPA